MREDAFLRWLRSKIRRGGDVLVGPGHDVAFVREGGRVLALKVDNVVQGVHFLRAAPREVGRKAMARPLSDLAAAGAVPRFALVGWSVPERFGARALRQLFLGLWEMGRQWRVRIVGGDLTVHRGPLVVSVSVLGVPGPAGPILRCGARPGDSVFVTGLLGGSILRKHLRFTPRVREAQELARTGMVKALMDISDGLLLDLSRLCRESRVGAVLVEDWIPVSPDAVRLSRRDGRSPLDHALSDGEDYELLGAAGSPELFRRCPFAVRIGRFTRASGIRMVRRDGSLVSLSPRGWKYDL